MAGLISRLLLPLRSPLATGCASAVLGCALCACNVCAAQVFTVERDHIAGKSPNLTNFQPTSVQLGNVPIRMQTRAELIRIFQSEQAFAVRPLPLGRRGLVLHANGPLSPSGKGYVDELEKNGISCKPGDRVVISKFDVRRDRIVFEFNGGPDKHHRILQHIEIGGGYTTVPLAQDDGEEPVGSRLTLLFPRYVPEMNAAALRGLIAPMLDFSLKTPVQAFADTLPPKLKAAVLDHEVLVGMNRDMVVKALGLPDQKVRETNGQMPFEEWIYGEPPHEVQFVRFNGNRVIRLEIADVGQPPIIRDKDETDGYFSGQFVRQVRLGDAPPVDPNQEHGPRAAPSLRKPGEDLPDAVDSQGQLKPVQFPKDDAKPNPIPPPPNQPSADSGVPGQDPGAMGNQGPFGQNPMGQNPSIGDPGVQGAPSANPNYPGAYPPNRTGQMPSSQPPGTMPIAGIP
ncbi:MAG TPA: hypothetical protein VGR96_02620 [Acidobacteriaceae bacterium]|nr:hypothetical protein [Acidobacteriaceae bacterium]